MKPQDAKDASVGGEIVMGTWGKWSKAQSPTTKPLAASHLQLTHPNQPTPRKEQMFKNQIKYKIKNHKGQFRQRQQGPES